MFDPSIVQDVFEDINNISVEYVLYAQISLRTYLYVVYVFHSTFYSNCADLNNRMVCKMSTYTFWTFRVESV